MKKIHFRLPAYATPRLKWRAYIHSSFMETMQKNKFVFPITEKIALDIHLFLSAEEISFHDVDNRLKDIMDALQGRIGGDKKSNPKFPPIILNDNQVYKVSIEKSLPHKQSLGLGHVIMTAYK